MGERSEQICLMAPPSSMALVIDSTSPNIIYKSVFKFCMGFYYVYYSTQFDSRSKMYTCIKLLYNKGIKDSPS